MRTKQIKQNRLTGTTILLGLVCCLVAYSCGNDEKISMVEIDTSGSANGIVTIPESAPEVVKSIFVKYTKWMAPNGKPIQFLAQDGWTDEQVLHARDVLQHLLTNYPGSKYGDDKSIVANSMSDKRATMVLFNDVEAMEAAFDAGLDRLDLSMQDLRSNESPAVGDKDYMKHVTRDAAYEEVWHLVHDYGVVPTLPDMTAEMRVANDVAAAKGWDAWPEDEPQEHPNEYVGVLIDNYYDLWMVTPSLYEARAYEPGPQGTTHFGVYFANSRNNLKREDSLGFQLAEKFLHPYLTYTPQLPANFSGTFSIDFDSSLVYTYKSRHLVNVTLTGANDASLVGNDYDNVLTGNDGQNSFQGGKGADQINGMGGIDSVRFIGSMNEYEITLNDGIIQVADQAEDRDGIDQLRDIEYLLFADQMMDIQTPRK